MRHHKANRKFGRVRRQRTALMKSLVGALVTHGRIETTDAKARELRPVVEKLVTAGKDATLASTRLLVSKTGSKSAATKIIKEIAPKYAKRAGGYTRIIKLPRRIGDGSKMAVIEFV